MSRNEADYADIPDQKLKAWILNVFTVEEILLVGENPYGFFFLSDGDLIKTMKYTERKC